MRDYFGTAENGGTASLYPIENAGIKAVLSDYGAAIIALWVPDREGKERDIVLGYDNLKQYEIGNAAFGATIGRVAGRIENARFSMNGREYMLDLNDGKNCNHSGFSGYHKRIWQAGEGGRHYQTFHLESPDKDQGFPGSLHLSVRYSISEEGLLSIHYRAVCDRDTMLNVTNHAYFNLDGQESGTIEEQFLQISAEKYMPLRGEDYIPAGTVHDVQSTPFDFRTLKRIGQNINDPDEQIRFGQGYNHYFELDPEAETCIQAESRKSGIGIKINTDLPGVVLYTGNALDTEPGKRGAMYYPRCGFALETQYPPNCMNIPGAPSCLLKAGEVWETCTSLSFYVS